MKRSVNLIRLLLVTLLCTAMLSSVVMAAPKTANNYRSMFSKMFDADDYIAMYPELEAVYGRDKTKLFDHYMSYGIFEGKCPSLKVDPESAKIMSNQIVAIVGADAYGKNVSSALETSAAIPGLEMFIESVVETIQSIAETGSAPAALIEATRAATAAKEKKAAEDAAFAAALAAKWNVAAPNEAAIGASTQYEGIISDFGYYDGASGQRYQNPINNIEVVFVFTSQWEDWYNYKLVSFNSNIGGIDKISQISYPIVRERTDGRGYSEAPLTFSPDSEGNYIIGFSVSEIEGFKTVASDYDKSVIKTVDEKKAFETILTFASESEEAQGDYRYTFKFEEDSTTPAVTSETLEEIPAETSTETIEETPAETPAETPTETPEETPEGEEGPAEE